MTLTLQFKGQATVPVEVEAVTPEATRDLSLAAIQKIEIFHGNNKVELADFFSVTGDPSDARHVWQGELSGVHWIGTKMRDGEIRIESVAGRHVGSEMSGGRIDIEGDAGDWLGAEMRGGLIRVAGRAGHLVGAGYRGSPRGMRGGTILVHGDVGNEVGHSMRRGLIAVGGNCGDLAGFNMLAGSIFIFGTAGIRQGAGMKRGTLGFFGAEAPDLLPTFVRACRFRPDVMSVIFAFLKKHDFPVPDALKRASFDVFHGDMLEGGRGEVLVPVLV